MEEYIFMTLEGKYIGLDSKSGGYPYETNRWQDAKIWLTKKNAYEYYAMFQKSEWRLRTINGLNFLDT